MLRLIGTAGAVTAVAAFGVSGCAADRAAPPPAPAEVVAQPPAGPPPADSGPLPAPEALADVLYRLADPNIPGNEKLPLVQDATGPDAAALDTFATALRDNGFSPMTITASDIAWSPEQPGDVLATVEFAAADTDDPEGFSFPMGFRRTDAGWQLTRDTAEELFAIGGPSAGAPAQAPPP
ncbi:MAG: hypothetical protein H6521_16590 [Mycolicibacterium sp.]|nr:hypothetical protein [Mycobacterium sp.]MCB9410954.1 hypothetical protein [Mycolicibacterium sp.]